MVQDLIIRPFNVRYRLERWISPEGEYFLGTLPDEVKGSHFGTTLKKFILYQYYHAHVTQPLLHEQLIEMGIDISSGQVNSVLIDNKESYHEEKKAILQIGLEVSAYVNVDDTGARHEGKNGYCTHIGNEYFAYFESTESKSRMNFLQVLRGGRDDYVINCDAIAYMKDHKLPLEVEQILSGQLGSVFDGESIWKAQLEKLGINQERHIQIATEGALLGSVIEHGINPNLVIVSDDAGQFDILRHGLCWIHAERTIHKLIGYTDEQREALEQKRGEIWDYYRELKTYKTCPTEAEKVRLENRFDEIFKEKTCFVILNNALERLYKNKDELLLVLSRPEIPLHNNLSESDIREYVKKRKISGSTRSSPGRRCRDTFTSLKKTCRKLGVSFWEYLQDRLTGVFETIPYLPKLIQSRACEAGT